MKDTHIELEDGVQPVRRAAHRFLHGRAESPRRERPPLVQTALVALVLLAALTAAAPPEGAPLGLDPRRSTARFSLNGGWAAVSGVFTSLGGTLLLDKADFARSQIELRIDLSKVAFDGQSSGAQNPLAPVLGSLDPPHGTFRSTRITRRTDTRFDVDGVFVRGAKKRSVRVPVVVVSSSPSEVVARVALAGGVEELSEDAPLLQLLQGARASVQGTLHFSQTSRSARPSR